MAKIKILLVDDEDDALSLLESLLDRIDYVQVVGKAANKADAISKVIELQPDVIFQDIQMHGTSGLDLVDEYRKYHFNGKIVFVTAHSEYAIKAIKKMAYDYLLKPVDIEELQSLTLRLLADQSELGHESNQLRKLKIPTRQGYSLIPVNDIIYCEADGNYTSIATGIADKVTTSVNLGKIEKELSDTKFFRINRSVLINTDYLTSINKGDKLCQLMKSSEEITLQISSKRIKALERIL